MATKIVQGERKAKLVWAFPTPQPVLRRMKIGNRQSAYVLRR